ncbi:hypothetical protein Cni_G22555 [Canna indica]|uniref:Uncharacterized protein n=1 Tax=Canna indica TaxID=4628 RepID=A0AAQ3QID9_9LILI|nr:hypothetical protein Cni_G22555 [Canna indica]
MADGGDGKAKHGRIFICALNSLFFHSLADGAPPFLLSHAYGGRLLRLLRRSLFLSIQILVSILSLLLSHFPSPPSPRSRASASTVPSPSDSTSAGRALSRVLSAVVRVPVASRKYDLVRSLADRILDENLRFNGDRGAALQDLNRAVLSASFARTLVLLEEAVAAGAAAGPGDGSEGRIMGALKSSMRRWAAPLAEGGFGGSAEKLAAEALWLGQKMAESGAAKEAVAMWGAASRLAAHAISAEPRLQVAFVRVCASLFKHANSKQLGEKGEEENGIDFASSQMAMLRSWLPLLCRACSGVDTPALSIREKTEMLSVLEEMIEKLSWDKQEEILSLWLHHFTICADSDWPNLETCYMRWYSESRKLLK